MKKQTIKIISTIALIFLMLMPLITAAQVFPNPSNLTTPLKSLSYINSLTDVGMGPMLGTIIYFLLVGVLFMGMKAFSTDRAAAVTLFITSVLAVILRIFGFLNDFAIYLSLILLVLSLFKLWSSED